MDLIDMYPTTVGITSHWQKKKATRYVIMGNALRGTSACPNSHIAFVGRSFHLTRAKPCPFLPRGRETRCDQLHRVFRTGIALARAVPGFLLRALASKAAAL